MGSKLKTYILLALVLGIWGGIAYKIFSGLNPEQESTPSQNFNVAFKKPEVTKTVKFDIKPLSRDPFLGTLLIQRPPKKIKKKTLVKPKTQWLPIQYNGVIQKDDGSVKLYIISINGQQRILKKNQSFKDVTVIKGSNNEVTLQFKGEKKTFNKQ